MLWNRVWGSLFSPYFFGLKIIKIVYFFLQFIINILLYLFSDLFAWLVIIVFIYFIKIQLMYFIPYYNKLQVYSIVIHSCQKSVGWTNVVYFWTWKGGCLLLYAEQRVSVAEALTNSYFMSLRDTDEFKVFCFLEVSILALNTGPSWLL